jgi:hypothetical protein
MWAAAILGRGRRRLLTEHYFLWRHLRRHACPDLTFAGGKGERVLAFARWAAASAFEQRQRRDGSSALEPA